MDVFHRACNKAELSIAQCFWTGVWHSFVFLSSFGDGGDRCSTRTI